MQMKHLMTLLAAGVAAMGQAWGYGGDKAYPFLNLPTGATVNALGGSNVSAHSADVSLSQQNPALLGLAPERSLALTYMNHVAGTQYGGAMWGQALDSASWVGVGLNYLGYGSMEGYDEYDRPTGSFSAQDMNLQLTYARRLARRVTAGLSLKPVCSHIEDYSSWGVAIDVGAAYHNPEKLFSAGVAIRNFGVQLTSFDQNRERLPWDVQLGVTKKLEHAPFRLHLTYTNLNEWDLGYRKDASLYESTSQVVQTAYKRDVRWGDMLMRHLVLAADFVPGKNFWLTAAYNHRQHREFDMDNAGGGSGWSFGANLQARKFALGASYAIYGAKEGVFGISLRTLFR